MNSKDEIDMAKKARLLMVLYMYGATSGIGGFLAVMNGNSAGGLVVFLACCVVFTICSRYFKLSDLVLCPIGTLIWVFGSFVFLGTGTESAVFLKNGVQITSPFLAIPFREKIEPMVQWVDASVQYTSTIHSFEPSKVEPRTVTMRASVTARSRDEKLFVLDSTQLRERVKGKIRNMFVTSEDVDGYAKIAAQSLREGLEKDFPNLTFTGSLQIVYSGSAHSAL